MCVRNRKIQNWGFVVPKLVNFELEIWKLKTSVAIVSFNPDPKEVQPLHQEKEGPNLTPREGRANPLPRVGRTNICHFFEFYPIMIMKPSHPQPKGGCPPQGLNPSFTLEGQAWPPNFRPPLLLGQAWLLPFLLAGLVAFPFSLFGSGLAFSSFGSGPGQPDPKGPTPTPRRKGQQSPREKRPTITQGKEGPTQQEGPTPNWKRKGKHPLRKLPTPSQEWEGPTLNPEEEGQPPYPLRRANPYPRVGRANPTLRRKGQSPPSRERKTKKEENDSYEEQEKFKENRNIKQETVTHWKIEEKWKKKTRNM